MIVDLILKTGVAPGVCALLPLEHDRATVRQDQPGPHQQYPRLAERDLAVIDPNQASPLGNEPMVAMSLLLFVFRARDHRGLDGDLQAEGDRRRTRRAGAQRRTLSTRLSCLARNGR